MKKWLALLVCALAFGLVAAGCGGDDDEEDSGGGSAQTTQQDPGPGDTTDTQDGAPAETTEVSIGDNVFEPPDVTVKKGSTIKWTNEGQAPHTVTHQGGPGGEFDSGNLDPGAEYEQDFNQAGKIDYVCTIHAGQSGTITVE